MYDRVFSPLKIRSVEVPNRIVRPAHVTMLATREPVTDDLIAYHLERARGGVGLSILEACSVHPSSYQSLINWDDSVIPHYRKLASAIAPTGMKLFQQLWHGGHILAPADGNPPWAPSEVTARHSTCPPLEMTTDQIEELVVAFGAAARRVEAGGLDGIELHAGHGYLVAQFLSPVLNQRNDRYGGSIENRRRFLLETLREIRAQTSAGFPVGMRISESGDPAVFPIEEANAVCRLVEDEGLIDYINISHSDYYDTIEVIAGMESPVGYQLPTARRIGHGLKVPRLVSGRFGTLDDAEQAIRAGDADLVGIVRAAIADPDLIKKSREGRATEVRPCIACNQGCVGGVMAEGRIGCVVNPAAGREGTLAESLLDRSTPRRKVVIVGGGPAGMEAARVAALRGHEVILFEATPSLGGMINHARRLPKQQAIGDITNWLEAEVYRLGVDVRLSTYPDADEVLSEVPDAVVVATGASKLEGPIRQVAHPATEVRVAPGAIVMDAIDLLDSKRNDLGRSAVVVDDVGHYEAIGCCEELLNRGMDVIYVTRHGSFAPLVQATMRDTSALKRLYKLGKFNIVTQAFLAAAEPGWATVQTLIGERADVIPADVVIRVDFRSSANTLWRELRERVKDIHLVGDAKSSRTLQTAIREGHAAGRAVG
ncbi:oxidoreductase [Sphingobium mellinum]|uniref:oxidoreductase n=1 Tax=Sphingobium mellinum TaxID=1387166 RepID=UPI0030EDB8B1